MRLNDESVEAWKDFLSNSENMGHLNRDLLGDSIDKHVQECWLSVMNTANIIKRDIYPYEPKTILEIGSSAGLIVYALSNIFPNANFIGIEPEKQAVKVANSMLFNSEEGRIKFLNGVGEKLPFENNSIDLIICHTVIEHVDDVRKVISEMVRVLKAGGYIHLDAPNYNWPYEPHLNPRFGKKFVSFCAWLQFQRNVQFLNHLKFVTPGSLEKVFSEYELEVENRVIKKVRSVINGEQDQVKAFKKLSKIIYLISLLGLGNFLVFIIEKLGIYPSVLYTIKKK